MSLRLEGVFAADAGVLIDLVYGTERGVALREALLSDSVALITHELALVELRYILCRRLGRKEAWARADKLLASGYLIIEDASELMEDAALLKCERRISLPDCFTLALADKMRVTALFAQREAELDREMESRALNVNIGFLSDLSV